MENNLDLFDKYIDGSLSDEERKTFNERLEHDSKFAEDFRIHLMILDGIYREAWEENTAFGMAMRNISEEDLIRAIGRYDNTGDSDDTWDPLGLAVGFSESCWLSAGISDKWDESDMVLPPPPPEFDIIDIGSAAESADNSDNSDNSDKSDNSDNSDSARSSKRQRLLTWGWAASVVVLVAIGATLSLSIMSDGRANVDDTIVAYNYIYTPSRDGSEQVDLKTLSDSELRNILPELVKDYRDADSDDMQGGEEAGMRLAMAYLMLHDRSKARDVLKEMSVCYADDREFAAQCQDILARIR